LESVASNDRISFNSFIKDFGFYFYICCQFILGLLLENSFHTFILIYLANDRPGYNIHSSDKLFLVCLRTQTNSTYCLPLARIMSHPSPLVPAKDPNSSVYLNQLLCRSHNHGINGYNMSFLTLNFTMENSFSIYQGKLYDIEFHYGKFSLHISRKVI